MKKLWIGMMIMVVALAGTAQAAVLAEFTFDTDTSDTAGGYDGILGAGARVENGELILDGGGYMDLPAAFGAINPFDGSVDFSIKMDFKTTTAGILMSSAVNYLPANHSMALFVNQAGDGRRYLRYDQFWVGQLTVGENTIDFYDDVWRTVIVTYDAFSGTMKLLCEGETGTSQFNPAIPDIINNTVRLGGSLNPQYPYSIMSSPSTWSMTVDNVRIYDEVIAITNHAPSFASDPINEIDAIVDEAYDSTIADDASDPDDDPMTFTFSEVSGPGPSWLSVSTNGVLSGTPGATNIGDHVFTVQVAATGGTNTATLNISVVAELVNIAPSFSSDPIIKIDATEDVEYSNSIADDASDPEGDPMTFSKVDGPDWLSVSTNGVLSGTPGTTNVGLNAFTVQVDATGGTNTAVLNIYVDAVVEEIDTVAFVVYHDTFDNDGLATNAGIGGGLEAVTHLGANWVENGDLSRAAGGEGDRAYASSLNAFDLGIGFTLTVKWIGVPSEHGDSFGLSTNQITSTTADNDWLGYGGVGGNRDSAVIASQHAFYGIGFAFAGNVDITDPYDTGLKFNNASGLPGEDGSGQLIQLSDEQTWLIDGSINTLVMTVVGDQYSYSINGETNTTGKIVAGAGIFDLSQPLYFNAYSQWGGTTITEVKLESLVEREPVRIEEMTLLSGNVMKLEVSSQLASYFPASTPDLVIGSWERIPHSDNGVNPFIVTNLNYSTTDGTNQIIYVQGNDTEEFIRIQSAD